MAKVLIIEPDLLLGDVYSKTITNAGHKVRLCHDAQAAVNLIDQQLPDVIVLELQLTSHGGLEFVYELRSYSEWQGIPIIVHSLVPENLFSDNSLQIRKLGVTHFLYKPSTNLVSLSRAVNEALDLSSSAVPESARSFA